MAGEVAADIIRKQLYGKEVKDLTEEEKQTISALSQLASGLAVAAGGGNFGDASAAISSSKNAVENNNLLLIPRVAWQVIRPSALGEPVTITAVDVLIARGLVADAQEAEAFLGGLTLEQRKLIELALVDPTGDENFENAVVKTYDTYYNEYLKKKASNKKNKTSDYASAGDSSTASGGANLQPDDDNDKKDKNNSSNKDDKKGVGGNGAASELPSLNGKSPEEARKLLEGQGFSSGKISPNGWQKFKAKDGSKVDINWNTGRVVRTAAPKYGQNGSTINKGQRLDSSGSEIPRNLSHELHPTETINFK